MSAAIAERCNWTPVPIRTLTEDEIERVAGGYHGDSTEHFNQEAYYAAMAIFVLTLGPEMIPLAAYFSSFAAAHAFWGWQDYASGH